MSDSIKLKDDYVVSADLFSNDEFICVITSKGTMKRVRLSEFECTSRGRKGVLLVRDVKTNPYRILKTFICDKSDLVVRIGNDFDTVKFTSLPIMDRYSTGSSICKGNIVDAFIASTLIDGDNYLEVESQDDVETVDIDLDNIDEQILTIDDFLDDFDV